MPNIITRTINPEGGADYTSISAWIAAIPADLVSADQAWHGVITLAGNNKTITETGPLVFSGFITDQTRDIRLIGFNNRITVGANHSNFLSIRGQSNGAGYLVSIQSGWVSLINLRIGQSGLDSDYYGRNSVDGIRVEHTSGNVQLLGCYLEGPAVDNARASVCTVKFIHGGGRAVIAHSIVYGGSDATAPKVDSGFPWDSIHCDAAGETHIINCYVRATLTVPATGQTHAVHVVSNAANTVIANTYGRGTNSSNPAFAVDSGTVNAISDNNASYGSSDTSSSLVSTTTYYATFDTEPFFSQDFSPYPPEYTTYGPYSVPTTAYLAQKGKNLSSIYGSGNSYGFDNLTKTEAYYKGRGDAYFEVGRQRPTSGAWTVGHFEPNQTPEFTASGTSRINPLRGYGDAWFDTTLDRAISGLSVLNNLLGLGVGAFSVPTFTASGVSRMQPVVGGRSRAYLGNLDPYEVPSQTQVKAAGPPDVYFKPGILPQNVPDSNSVLVPSEYATYWSTKPTLLTDVPSTLALTWKLLRQYAEAPPLVGRLTPTTGVGISFTVIPRDSIPYLTEPPLGEVIDLSSEDLRTIEASPWWIAVPDVIARVVKFYDPETRAVLGTWDKTTLGLASNNATIVDVQVGLASGDGHLWFCAKVEQDYYQEDESTSNTDGNTIVIGEVVGSPPLTPYRRQKIWHPSTSDKKIDSVARPCFDGEFLVYKYTGATPYTFIVYKRNPSTGLFEYVQTISPETDISFNYVQGSAELLNPGDGTRWLILAGHYSSGYTHASFEIYKQSGSTFSFQQRILATDTARFTMNPTTTWKGGPHCMVSDGRKIVFGATENPYQIRNYEGSVAQIRYNGTNFELVRFLRTPHWLYTYIDNGDWYDVAPGLGDSLALVGETLLVGAPYAGYTLAYEITNEVVQEQPFGVIKPTWLPMYLTAYDYLDGVMRSVFGYLPKRGKLPLVYTQLVTDANFPYTQAMFFVDFAYRTTTRNVGVSRMPHFVSAFQT